MTWKFLELKKPNLMNKPTPVCRLFIKRDSYPLDHSVSVSVCTWLFSAGAGVGRSGDEETCRGRSRRRDVLHGELAREGGGRTEAAR